MSGGPATPIKTTKPKERKYSVVFSDECGGYIRQYAYEPLEYKLVSRKAAFKVRAGYEKEFFPQFDPEIHTVDVDIPWSYETEQNKVTLNDASKKGEVQLPFGTYTLKIVSGTATLVPLTINSDEYIDFGQKAGAKFLEDFKLFKKSRNIYSDEKQVHRKGCFAFGPPGCGKTMEISKLLKEAKNENFYGIIVESRIGMDGLFAFRDVLKDFDKVVVLEEVTERMQHHPVEEMLSFMDGETSWDHVYIIATTNYPEELAPNMIDRPRRFSTICYVDYPTDEQKKAFLKSKNISDKDANEIIKQLGSKISMDYVREVVLLSRLENKPYVDVIKEIKENRRLISKSFRGTIGLRPSGGGTPELAMAIV